MEGTAKNKGRSGKTARKDIEKLWSKWENQGLLAKNPAAPLPTTASILCISTFASGEYNKARAEWENKEENTDGERGLLRRKELKLPLQWVTSCLKQDNGERKNKRKGGSFQSSNKEELYDPTPVNLRPALTLQQATDLMQKFYGRTVTKISTLPCYVDQNFLIVDREGAKYILKIINAEESKNTTLLELQTLARSFVHQNGIPVQTAFPNNAGEHMSMEEIDVRRGAQTFCVKSLNYIPGKTIAESELTMQDLYHGGRMAATLNKTLQELVSLNLDFLQREDYVWCLDNVAFMKGKLSVLDGDPMREVVEAVTGQFKSCVLPKISSF